MTSAVVARSAARIASRSSGTIGPVIGSPPSRVTSAASIGPLASVIRKPSGGVPIGSNSLPVMRIRTRGRRMTGAWLNPSDDSMPMSCGRKTRPALATTSPARTSSPSCPTCLPGETSPIASTRWPSIWAFSIGRTASAPSGSGAPVMIRTALPGAIASFERARRKASCAENFQRQWIVGRRPLRILGHDREAVHHRPGEAWNIYGAGDIAGQHAAGRAQQRNFFDCRDRQRPATPNRPKPAHRRPSSAARTHACGRRR